MLRVLEANRLMSRGREGLSFGWLLGGRKCDWDIQRFWAVKDAPSARKRKGRMQGGNHPSIEYYEGGGRQGSNSLSQLEQSSYGGDG